MCSGYTRPGYECQEGSTRAPRCCGVLLDPRARSVRLLVEDGAALDAPQGLVEQRIRLGRLRAELDVRFAHRDVRSESLAVDQLT